MKILCSAAVFLLIGWQGLQAQQNLSQMRVSFEIGKTPAPKAVEKFLTENNIQYNYSTDDLKNYTVQPFKCKNEPVMDCLKKMLKDIPVETLIYNNSIIIRPKKKQGHIC